MSYAGDVSATDCWSLMRKHASFLVDVRTSAELSYVGIPVLEDSSRLLFEEWQTFPGMTQNPEFVDNLSDSLGSCGGNKNSHLYFLCRSGVRSASAAEAMTGAGYPHCYNITGGFEGDPDNEGHRGTQSGWKVSGLPWKQT